jgi:hypothetical protein
MEGVWAASEDRMDNFIKRVIVLASLAEPLRTKGGYKNHPCLKKRQCYSTQATIGVYIIPKGSVMGGENRQNSLKITFKRRQ